VRGDLGDDRHTTIAWAVWQTMGVVSVGGVCWAMALAYGGRWQYGDVSNLDDDVGHREVDRGVADLGERQMVSVCYSALLVQLLECPM
jgi:hypothetical protein